MGELISEPSANPARREQDRLESWKEIAAFLDRDIRTVQRWERLEGLPVYRRRHGRLGGVFAYRSEIVKWQGARQSPSRREEGGAGVPPRRRFLVLTLVAAGLVVASLAFVRLGGGGRLASAVGLGRSCTMPAGVAGLWRADDSRDTVTGRDLVLEHGATYAPGQAGQAFLLDGRGARIRASNAIRPVTDVDLTVAAWVRFNSIINPRAARRAPYDDMSLVDRMAPSPDPLMATGHNLNGWRLLKQSDHRFWFCVGGRDVNRCGSPTNTVFSTTLATPGAWYHVAGVKSSRDLSIYVNGNAEDTRPLPAPDLMLDTAVTGVLLGAHASEAAFLNGLLDEVVIFERALLPGEIRTLMEATGPGCTS